ncbi:MAG: AraC family transcriptional regulator [Pseudomonadota bacterium]
MSVYAPATDYLWELIRSYDIDPRPVFERAGIDPALRFDKNARLSRPQMNELHRVACEATGDEALGLRVVNTFHPSHMGPLGYAWLASATPGDAWCKMKRHSRVESDTFQLSLDEGAGEREDEVHIGYAWEGDWSPIRSQIFMVMALLVHLHRRIAGPDANPLRVEFSVAPPESLQVFQEHFRCPLVFDAPRELLVLPMGVMNQPTPRGLPELEQATEQMVVRYLAFRDKTDILSQVRAALFECLPEGNITAVRIAEQLHMTDRTLRRRLEDQGLSFRDVLNDVRRSLAQRYIADEQLSLTEISYLLGFSEPSSFTRAYRGWTGKAPSAARSGEA